MPDERLRLEIAQLRAPFVVPSKFFTEQIKAERCWHVVQCRCSGYGSNGQLPEPYLLYRCCRDSWATARRLAALQLLLLALLVDSAQA